MISKMCDESTYPFPNFNGFTVEIWESISNFISHFNMNNYLSILNSFMLVKGAPGAQPPAILTNMADLYLTAMYT